MGAIKQKMIRDGYFDRPPEPDIDDSEYFAIEAKAKELEKKHGFKVGFHEAKSFWLLDQIEDNMNKSLALVGAKDDSHEQWEGNDDKDIVSFPEQDRGHHYE